MRICWASRGPWNVFKATEWNTWKARANRTELYLLKTQKINRLSVLLLNVGRMIRLILEQWKQAIGKCNARQRPHLGYLERIHHPTSTGTLSHHKQYHNLGGSTHAVVVLDLKRYVRIDIQKCILRKHTKNRLANNTTDNW